MYYFSSRICPKVEPERGCLARPSPNKPRPNSCPILDLPVEIRVQILNFIVETDELHFLLQPDQQIWHAKPEYKSSLSLFKVCKSFETEALSFLKVRCLRLEIKSETDQPIYRRPGVSLPLTLGHLQCHVEQLTIDANTTLPQLLDAKILDAFPRLKQLVVTQTEKAGRNVLVYPAKLDTAAKQRSVVRMSLTGSIVCHGHNTCTWECGAGGSNMACLLASPQLARFRPLRVEARLGTGAGHGRTQSYDGEIHYPQVEAVEALRVAYLWPEKRILKLSLDLFNQPMAVACKSRWTEEIPLVCEKK